MDLLKTDSLKCEHDCYIKGGTSCESGFFIKDLLLYADSGILKIFRLKSGMVPWAIQIKDTDSTISAGMSHTCEGWLKIALSHGFYKNLGEVFPSAYHHRDFDETNHQHDVEQLTARLDTLDTVNMLDAEFVAALQSGGQAYSEIAAQVAAEASLRSGADSALDARVQSLELDPTTQSLLTAESLARTSADSGLDTRVQSLEADPTTQSLLTAESVARANADSGLDTRVQSLEADPTTQSLLTAESVARAAADSALDTRIQSLESDPITSAQVDVKVSTATAALVNGAPATLDTLKEISDALGADANLSVTLTNAIAAKQDTNAHLTAVIGAARTQAQLASVDTTSSIATALGTKQDTNAHLTAAIAAQRTQAQLESVDTTSSIATALSGKQDALTDASGLNVNGSNNVGIGMAAGSGAAKLSVKGHASFEHASSSRKLTIDAGGKIEASWQSSDALDLRIHGTGAVRVSRYSGGATNVVASIAQAQTTINSSIIVFSALPTSNSGLVSGQLWSDSGVLKIA